MDKTFRFIFGGVFGFIGVTFLIVAFFMMRSEISFREGAIATPGTVIDLAPTQSSKGSTSYRPVFNYTDRDDKVHTVTGSLVSSPPSFRRGEAITVLYRPEDPEGAQIYSFMESWLLPLIFGSIGTTFTAIASGVGFYSVRRRRRRLWLETNGTRIPARVNGVGQDMNTSSRGRHPWRITAQWQNPADHKVYLFSSDPIWFDPTPYVQPDTVEVLINVNDPHQYTMNIDFLPKPG